MTKKNDTAITTIPDQLPLSELVIMPNAQLEDEGFELDPVKLEFDQPGMRFRAIFERKGPAIELSDLDPETGEPKQIATWVFRLLPQHGRGLFWISGAAQLDRKLTGLMELYDKTKGGICIVDITRETATKLTGGKTAGNFSVNHAPIPSQL